MGQQATAPPPHEDSYQRPNTGGGRGSLQFNRPSTTSSYNDEDYDEPYEPYKRTHNSHKDLPSMVDFSTEDKSQELCGILKALEVQLENPTDYGVIGRTYRRLAEWTWEHQQDSDFPQVLELLTPEHMYPAWRRQALEEAYMLFFEDCAKQGNPKALEQLPEPPTSKEIGYRPLPEALLDPKTTRGTQAFSNTYEAGNACCIRRRWQYDVVRNGPRPRPGERKTAGRKIVPKDTQQRYCACAVDPMTRLMQVILPENMCCGRDRKAIPVDHSNMEDSRSSKAGEVIHSTHPRTALAPPSTAQFKSKPSTGKSGAAYTNSGWPAPPHSHHDHDEDDVENDKARHSHEFNRNRMGRGDQTLLAKDIMEGHTTSITV